MQSSSVSPASSLSSTEPNNPGLMSMYDFDSSITSQTGNTSKLNFAKKSVVQDSCGEVNQLGGVFVNGRPLPNTIRQKVNPSNYFIMRLTFIMILSSHESAQSKTQLLTLWSCGLERCPLITQFYDFI